MTDGSVPAAQSRLDQPGAPWGCAAAVPQWGQWGSREEGTPVSPALVPSAATSLQNGCEEAEGAGAGGVCPEAGDGEGGDCDQVWLEQVLTAGRAKLQEGSVPSSCCSTHTHTRTTAHTRSTAGEEAQKQTRSYRVLMVWGATGGQEKGAEVCFWPPGSAISTHSLAPAAHGSKAAG